MKSLYIKKYNGMKYKMKKTEGGGVGVLYHINMGKNNKNLYKTPLRNKGTRQ